MSHSTDERFRCYETECARTPLIAKTSIVADYKATKIKTPITTGEATFEALQSSSSRVLLLAAVAWLGVVAGYWLIEGEFSIWSGNPLSWLYFQSLALKSIWGYFFLALQILAFYIWAFTDSFRLLSLAVSFVSNGLQIYVIAGTIRVDSNWFVCAGLIALIVIGTYAGWRLYHILNHRGR